MASRLQCDLAGWACCLTKPRILSPKPWSGTCGELLAGHRVGRRGRAFDGASFLRLRDPGEVPSGVEPESGHQDHDADRDHAQVHRAGTQGSQADDHEDAEPLGQALHEHLDEGPGFVFSSGVVIK